MALGATCWTSRFVGLFGLLMASFTVLMVGILCGNGLPLEFGLMAVFAQLATGLALLPSMMALQTVDLQCFGMLFVGECHLSLRRCIFNHILCSKNASGHHNGEQKAYQHPHAD